MDGFRSRENPERCFGFSIYTLRNDNSKKVNNKEKKKNDNLPLKIAVFLAQKEGFEPSRRFPDLLP